VIQFLAAELFDLGALALITAYLAGFGSTRSPVMGHRPTGDGDVAVRRPADDLQTTVVDSPSR